MIVIGADTHKSSHTFAAVDAVSGALVGMLTVSSTAAGAEQALVWARRLGRERVWAIEDCRHVSGRLERGLVARGEQTVRVAPKLMAAALREGVERLPGAHLDERALEIRLLLDHHDDLVADRGDEQRRLRWHLHDLFENLEIPAGALDRELWLGRLDRRLRAHPPTARVRIAREQIRSIRAQSKRIRALEAELAALVSDYAPQLLDEIGCGPLTAAKLIGELAGAERFATDAQLARTAGVAPIPVSSGRRDRHRLDRGGNRQLNLALHRLAVNKGRLDPQTADYLKRKQAEGKTRMEALRCLKRHLARRIWQLLRGPRPGRNTHTHMTHNNNVNAPAQALALT